MKRTQTEAGIELDSFFVAPDELDCQSLLAGITNVYNFRSWWNAILAVPLDRFE
jgi:hypothetical protein